MPIQYDLIPEELRWTNQWCVAGPDEVTGKFRAPYKPTPYGLRKASPTNSATWSDFETVREFAEANQPYGIGIVLAPSDCYVCIDLDIKNEQTDPTKPELWTSQENIDRYHKIIMSFHSYTERSAGGFGYHIWLKGHSGPGVRRDGVEVYSQERFLVCTGDVVLDAPIAENQELLDLLIAEIRKAQAAQGPLLTLVDIEQTESDEVIVERAMTADNGAKFIALAQGKWVELGYPSHSEADIAILTILAFYSKSNAQVIRIFRTTELGKREKAVKNDYYALRTLKIVRRFEANEATSSAVGEKMAAALVQRLTLAQQPPTAPPVAPPTAPQAGAAPPAQPVTPPWRGNILPLNAGKPISSITPPELPPIQPTVSIEYPPGLVGEIAQHIYNSSPRPIREVAIVSAMGLVAGVLGKAYCIPQSGLNLYVILVGQSAIGKEAMHSGISSIMRRVVGIVPGSPKYVDFTEYVSGPALTKAVAGNPSFINVSGEFGRRLQRMAMDERGDSPIQGLRTVMTNLYQKSGPTSMFGGLGYSDKEKNVVSTSGVSYSMIGETTPGTFYDSLTDSMMADGFLSRFTVVEYMGNRPPPNKVFNVEIDGDLLERIADLFRAAEAINNQDNDPRFVDAEPDALEFLDVLNTHCDREINGTNVEGWRQMWNRAHLKVYRIAALLAAADNYVFPVIHLEHVMWAYDLVMRDINIMTRRMDSGDVGISDATRENKLLNLCKKYLTTELMASYGIPIEMQKAGVIPRKYLQSNTQRITSFNAHKLGQVAALDLTLRSLCDGGYLAEIPKPEAIQKYNFHGKLYRVLNIPMGHTEAKEADNLQRKS